MHAHIYSILCTIIEFMFNVVSFLFFFGFENYVTPYHLLFVLLTNKHNVYITEFENYSKGKQD